jgi:hypothetical protein
MVRMWKLSSVAEVVESACYVEEHMNLTRGVISTFLHRLGFVGKDPWTFPRGGGSMPLPYGNRFHAKDSSYKDFNGSECSISFIANGADRTMTISGNSEKGQGFQEKELISKTDK